MADCWTCGAERGRAAFCPSCNKIQPVIDNTSYFVTLGLAPRMGLSRSELDRGFREVSRQVHPDRFGKQSRLERRLALEQTTQVNDAYRTLKKPRTRAEYLMKARGHDVGKETDRVTDMEFLTEMMELREELSDATTIAEINPLHEKIESRYETHIDELTRFFDEGQGEESDALRALERLRFYERFLDEVDLKLEARQD